MKKLISLFLSLILAGPALIYMQAQQTNASVNASGGNASGTGGSVSYSVGQVFNTTAFGTNGSVSEGVQQPFEISVLSGMDITGIDLYYAVYPNPTSGKLTLKLDASTTPDIRSMRYQLYDVNGKMLQNDRLTEYETSIEMSNFNSATYFLKVTKNNREVKLFKIIKN